MGAGIVIFLSYFRRRKIYKKHHSTKFIAKFKKIELINLLFFGSQKSPLIVFGTVCAKSHLGKEVTKS